MTYSRGPVHRLAPGKVRWEIKYRTMNDNGGWDPHIMWKTGAEDEETQMAIARELWHRITSKGLVLDILSIKSLGSEIPIQNTGAPTQIVSPEEYRRMKQNDVASLDPRDLRDRAREWGWPRLADGLTQKRIDAILKGE